MGPVTTISINSLSQQVAKNQQAVTVENVLWQSQVASIQANANSSLFASSNVTKTPELKALEIKNNVYTFATALFTFMAIAGTVTFFVGTIATLKGKMSTGAGLTTAMGGALFGGIGYIGARGVWEQHSVFSASKPIPETRENDGL